MVMPHGFGTRTVTGGSAGCTEQARAGEVGEEQEVVLRLAATVTQPSDTTWGVVVGPSGSRCSWNPDTVGEVGSTARRKGWPVFQRLGLDGVRQSAEE